MSSLPALPHDLKVLIFEFVPLRNYFQIQLVCRNFYYILLNTPRLWAKYMFSHFLDPHINEDIFLTENPFTELPIINKDKIKYDLITNARSTLETHYIQKAKWESFFGLFLSPSLSQELTQGIFTSLKTPSFPEPSLKKNIHAFPTNTFFQNFLTEVRFGIQGKSFMTEKKQAMVQNITDSLRFSLSKGGLDTDRLISLRWYFFNNSNKKKTNRNSSISNAHLTGEKRISKVRTFLRDGRLVTVMDRSHETDLRNPKLKGFNLNQKKWDRKFDFLPSSMRTLAPDNFESDTLTHDSERYDDHANLMEEFYRLIHALVKNHCQMVFIYLKTIQEHQCILEEYIRLWSEFVLSIQELNQALAPFSDLLNEVYNRNCEGLVNFPEFSVWRVMTKLWLNDVFTPLVSSFQTAFFTILMNIRIQDTFSRFNLLQLETSLADVVQAPDTSGISLKRILSNTFSQMVRLGDVEHVGEKSQNLLRQFYQTMSDLSYDEFTIFYMGCITVNSHTPEGIWNSVILKDTQQLYDYWKELLVYDPKYVISLFRNDLDIIESLFGALITCNLKEVQMTVLKDYLIEKFYAAVNQYESNSKTQNIMETEGDSNKISSITFGNIVFLLKPDEDVRKRVFEDKTRRDGVSKVLSRNCPMFSALLHLLMDVKQGLEYQKRELEEGYNERYLRGFPLIDEKYESFFSLNRNPSSRFVKGLPEGFSGGRSLGYINDNMDKGS